MSAALLTLAFGCAISSVRVMASEVERRLEPVAAATVKPAFTLRYLEGTDVALDQFAGRVVLVHFFATWCEPCQEELTSLAQLVAGPDAKTLTVLAVNVAEVSARVRRFLETSPVNFPVVLDADRAVTRGWGVYALPTTYVLDRKLTPRLVVEGDLSWQRADVAAALESLKTE